MCEKCGNSVEKLWYELCFNCYINGYVPSQTKTVDWLEISPMDPLTHELFDYDEEILDSIVSDKIQMDFKNRRIIVTLEESELHFEFNVEGLDSFAQKSGVRKGNWLIFIEPDLIDEVWKIIAKATYVGILGPTSKVSTAIQEQTNYVIKIGTVDYLDLEENKRMRDELRRLGFQDDLCYKPEIYTLLGIYSGNNIVSPCRYKY